MISTFLFSAMFVAGGNLPARMLVQMLFDQLINLGTSREAAEGGQADLRPPSIGMDQWWVIIWGKQI